MVLFGTSICRAKLRFNFTCVFKDAQFLKFPRRLVTRAICETLKTRVELNLNFTRHHAITYTNLPVKHC